LSDEPGNINPTSTNPPASQPPASTTAPVAAEAQTPAAETAAEPASKPQNGYWWGTGRRKTSVARVRIRPGDGKFVVNKKEINDYFRTLRDRTDVVAPLEAAKLSRQIDVFVNVGGGGTTGQAGAIVLGLARAISKYNPQHTQMLRDAKYMTRDSRKVERKKYGQSGARKRFQFSKR